MNTTLINQVSCHSLTRRYPLGWLQAYVFLNVTDKRKRKECRKLQATLFWIVLQFLPLPLPRATAGHELQSSVSPARCPGTMHSIWAAGGAESKLELPGTWAAQGVSGEIGVYFYYWETSYHWAVVQGTALLPWACHPQLHGLGVVTGQGQGPAAGLRLCWSNLALH